MRPAGDSALQSNTIGFTNTASGYRALFSNTTGSDNTVRASKPFPKLIPEGRASCTASVWPIPQSCADGIDVTAVVQVT